jgi:hypothetical protein
MMDKVEPFKNPDTDDVIEFGRCNRVWEILVYCLDCHTSTVCNEIRLFLTDKRGLTIVGKCSKCGTVADEFIDLKKFHKMVNVLDGAHPSLSLDNVTVEARLMTEGVHPDHLALWDLVLVEKDPSDSEKPDET